MTLAELLGIVEPKWRGSSLLHYIYDDSGMVTKIQLLMEEGKACFRTETRIADPHKLQTEVKARAWDDLLAGAW